MFSDVIIVIISCFTVLVNDRLIAWLLSTPEEIVKLSEVYSHGGIFINIPGIEYINSPDIPVNSADFPGIGTGV